MKIRTGFVSNSSSSSFAVYGIDMDFDEVTELAIKLGLKEEEIKKSEEEDDDEEDYSGNEDDDYELAQEVESHFLEQGLTTAVLGEGNNSIYVGLGFESMKDDETKADFMKRVEALIKKATKSKTKIKGRWIVEEIYN